MEKKIVKRADRLMVSLGKSLVVEPYETKMAIPPFKIKGTDIQAMVVISQIPKLLVTTSYSHSSEVTLQMHNARSEAKLPSYKTCLVGILLYPNTSLSWDTSVKDD